MGNEKGAEKPDAEATSAVNGALAASAAAGAIDQVRELLFGADKRAHETRLDDIDRRIEMLRDDMNAHFASLEAQIAEQNRDAENRRLAGVEAIGQAILDLGAAVRGMGLGKAR